MKVSQMGKIDNILDKWVSVEVHEQIFNHIWNIRLIALERGHDMTVEEIQEQRDIKRGEQKW